MKNKIWYLTIALFLVSLNLRTGITSIGPLMSTIQHNLSMTALTASLLTSIPVFCMGIFAPFAGILVRKIGINISIILCVAVIGISTGLRFFAHNILLLLITAFLLGIAIAIISPILSGFIKSRFPDRAPTMIGVYSLGIAVGALASTGLAVPLSNFLHSWQPSLGIWAILALIGLIAWIPIVDKRKKVKTPIEKSSTNPWKEGKAWLLLIAFGLQIGIYFSIATWLPSYLQSLGSSIEIAGAIVTLFTLVQTIASFVVPVLANYTSKRIPWLCGCVIFVFIGLLFICIIPTVISPWVIAALLGIGLGGLFPILLIIPLDQTSSASEASSWTAMMQCGGYILSGIIPLVLGAIKDATGSFQVPFLILIILSIILFLSVVCLREKHS